MTGNGCDMDMVLYNGRDMDMVLYNGRDKSSLYRTRNELRNR